MKFNLKQLVRTLLGIILVTWTLPANAVEVMSTLRSLYPMFVPPPGEPPDYPGVGTR